MAELYSNTPELAAEQEGILRRRKIAEMIQAQSLEASPNQIPQRGFAPNTALPNAIAKIAQAFFGAKGVKAADAEQKALGEKSAGMQSAERQKIVDALTPQAETQFTPDRMPGEQDPFGKLVETQARNQTPQDQLGSLVQAGGGAQFPLNQKWADTQQKYLEGKIAATAAQQTRTDAAKTLSEDRAIAAKIAAEAKLQAGIDRNDMLRAIAAGNNTSRETVADKSAASKEKIAGDKVAAKLRPANEKEKASAGDALKALQDNLFNLDKLIDEEGKPRPGFDAAVGTVDNYIPDVLRSEDSLNVTRALESVRSAKTIENLGLAKRGAGQSFGAMAVKEWPRFENLAENFRQDQNEGELAGNLFRHRQSVERAIGQLESYGSNGVPDGAPAGAAKAAPAGETRTLPDGRVMRKTASGWIQQ